MIAEINKGNFEFVRGMYENVCEDLQKIERNCRTDCDVARGALRDVMEHLTSELIQEYGLQFEQEPHEENNSSAKTLYDKIELLCKNEKFYGRLGFKCKNYIAADGKRDKKSPWYTYIRLLGNACSHSEEEWQPYWPIPNYENILKALKVMHNVMLEEYDRISSIRQLPIAPATRTFSEDAMPIGDRYIVSAQEPLDEMVSHCIKEYLTCSLDHYGKVTSYSLVRVYDKKKKESDVLMLRGEGMFPAFDFRWLDDVISESVAADL